LWNGVTLSDGGDKPNPFPRITVPQVYGEGPAEKEAASVLTVSLLPGTVSDPARDWVTPTAHWRSIVCHPKLFHRMDAHVGLDVPDDFFKTKTDRSAFLETFATINGTFNFRKMVAVAFHAVDNQLRPGTSDRWKEGVKNAVEFHTNERISPADKRAASSWVDTSPTISIPRHEHEREKKERSTSS